MITIKPQIATIKKGETLQFEVSKDFDGDVKFLTTNKNVATVDETGLVTAVGVSTAYITAIASKPGIQCSATARVEVPGLMMTPNCETEFEVKQFKTIVFSILKKHPANYEVQPVVEDETIASIAPVGASSYSLKALNEGSTKVTFNLIDPSIEVTDENDTSNVIDSVEYTITVGTINSLEFNNKTFECDYSSEEKEITIPVTVDPEDSEYKMFSDNLKIFKPTELNKGVPTGLGSTTLRIKRFDKADICKITVKGLKVTPIGTLSTKHCIILDVDSSEKGEPTFKSSDDTIATVTNKGVVTGIKVGSCKITVTLGQYSVVVPLECVEYFTPITELTDDIKKTIKIFTYTSDLKAYAKGRPIITDSIMEGLIPIHYIKTNCDPNLFEYELAILDKDLTRYNSLNISSGGDEPEPEPSDATIEVQQPDNLVVGQEVTVPVTLRATNAVEKVRVHFETSGPGNITYKMTDTLGQEFTFVNNGIWGPEEGFDIPEGYEATTQCNITADTEGTYNMTIKVVKVEDSSVVTEFTTSIDVLPNA